MLGHWLPMTLPLVNDHIIENKVIGLTNLLRLIRQVNATQLGWYRVMIIQALKLCLPFRDEVVVELLLPTLIETMMMLFTRPWIPSQSSTGSSASKSSAMIRQEASDDEELTNIVNTLLHEFEYMALTPSLKWRIVTQHYLTWYARLFMWLGSGVARWLSRLLPALLAFVLRHEPDIRRAAILALAALIQSCPERVMAHGGLILETVLKAWIDLSLPLSSRARPIINRDHDTDMDHDDPSSAARLAAEKDAETEAVSRELRTLLIDCLVLGGNVDTAPSTSDHNFQVMIERVTSSHELLRPLFNDVTRVRAAAAAAAATVIPTSKYRQIPP